MESPFFETITSCPRTERFDRTRSTMFWSSSTIRMTVLSGNPVSLLLLHDVPRRARRTCRSRSATRESGLNAGQASRPRGAAMINRKPEHLRRFSALGQPREFE